MSKFFFEQLARILLQQAEKGDADRGLFVPIIGELSVIRDCDIISFELIKSPFAYLIFPVDGLDKAYSFTHSKLY